MALRDEFIRRWRILRALEGGESLSAEELLTVLSADGAAGDEGRGRSWSRRTLQRDLAHLSRSGFPLEGFRRGHKMRYCLDEGYLASVPKPFRPSQWATLYYALSTLREAPGSPLGEEPLGPSASGLFARLKGFVPAGLRAYAQGIEPRYAAAIGTLREQGRLRRAGEALRRAIEERRPVRILGARLGESRRRWARVDPYLLRYREGNYHLLGREAARDALEIWPLPGVETVRLERGAFQLPLGLNLDAALEERLSEARSAGPEVRVRLPRGTSGEAVAAFFEEAFGPARLARSTGRGAVEVAVQVADPSAFRRCLLAFGPEAEVVSPKEFREAMRKDLEGALKKYRTGGRRKTDRPE